MNIRWTYNEKLMSHTGISQNTGKLTCKKAIVLNAPGVCAIKSKKKQRI